jgi:hypothetical protein
MKIALVMALLLAATPSDDTLDLTAASSSGPVKIRILRWSTDQERAPLLAALNPAPPPPAIAVQSPTAATTGARGGRGGARGRGRGPAATAPLTPIAAFTAALGRAPTIGYIWTEGVTGYAIKYAVHVPLPDGGQRMILASDRRLDAPGTTDYQFTLMELHVRPNGSLEGKTSLTSKIVVDGEAKTIALGDYAAAATFLSKN